MTAKRGTQWKTSWRRQKPAIGAGQPAPMWFFKNNGPFGSFFQFGQPLTAPSIGAGAPPFWAGGIYGTDLSAPSTSSATAFRSGAWFEQLSLNAPTPGVPLNLEALVSIPLGGAFLTQSLLPTLNPPLTPIQARAVVLLFVVEPIPGGYRESMWIDGTLQQQANVAGVYGPGVGTLGLGPGDMLVNSMAGGNALPTTQEIEDWFSATRYASPSPAAQPIPGKTSDRYDAGATPAVVPNPIVNLAGGQNAPIFSGGGPVPVNLLLNATFAY